MTHCTDAAADHDNGPTTIPPYTSLCDAEVLLHCGFHSSCWLLGLIGLVGLWDLSATVQAGCESLSCGYAVPGEIGIARGGQHHSLTHSVSVHIIARMPMQLCSCLRSACGVYAACGSGGLPRCVCALLLLPLGSYTRYLQICTAIVADRLPQNQK